jgi:hypothetical protein
MTAYRFVNPAWLFAVLEDFETLIAAEDWDSAAGIALKVEDEARHQKSADSKRAQLWREFIGHTECLRIAIRAQDREGCAGELAILYSALVLIGATERQA